MSKARSFSGDFDDLTDQILDKWTSLEIPIRPVTVEAKGSLSRLEGIVDSLAIPGDVVGTIQISQRQPSGTLGYDDAEDNTHQLAARFSRGDGEIIVLGDPLLLANRFLALLFRGLL